MKTTPNEFTPSGGEQRRVISMQSRFEIIKTGEKTFDIVIPIRGNISILNPDAVDSLRLSDGELIEAENAVLRSVAIIR